MSDDGRARARAILEQISVYHRMVAEQLTGDGRPVRQPLLDWRQPMPDVWISYGLTTNIYVIIRNVVPELPSRSRERNESYDIRVIRPESRRAWPEDLGYFAGHGCTLEYAKADAERMAWCDLQGAARHVPEDEPALALEHFFWPISTGTSRAALTVVVEDDRVLARVLGRGRANDDTYETRTWVEIDVTDVVAANPAPQWGWWKTLGWLLRGRPRPRHLGAYAVDTIAPRHPHETGEFGR